MPTFHVCTQAPNGGTLLKGKENEYLICAREERAKPIGDRRAGRWSPAERGRGGSGARPKRPRGFSVGPERATVEPEAGVAARLRRRDGRSSGARFPTNRSRNISPAIDEITVSGFPFSHRSEGRTGPAGTIQPEPSGARPKRPRGFSRGSELETSESEAGVAARIRRRDERSSSARISRKPEPGTYLPWLTK